MHKKMCSIIVDVLTKKLEPSFIILFGSYAKHTTHDESDVDIAFYTKQKHKVTRYEVFIVAQELASALKKEVDLVNIAEASTVFQAQIYSTGKVIFSKDNNLRMRLHTQAFSMYAKLNEERQPILQKIDESGSIYEK
ncbi:nucleotidyltransferase domain-containing protein [Sporolactobacillus sp. THM7-7]|nr:nucleotidyltransferase domain-containing protein [Sporolactobacillus sp. THM7-7]